MRFVRSGYLLIASVILCIGISICEQSTANGLVLLDEGAQCKVNVKMPSYYVPGGPFNACDSGYYCPFFNANDKRTYPVICPPDYNCSLIRHGGKWCLPQGSYEPMICTPGSYCPNIYSILPCPSGYFCPIGTYKPISCPFVSYCPTGSFECIHWGALLLAILVDIPTALLYLVFRLHESRKHKRQADEYMLQFDRNKKSDGKVIQTLIDNVNRCRGRHPLFQFEFENLGLILPNGKCILSNVSGKIPSGEITAVMGPSGAGKTTFISVLMGKVGRNSITQGKVFVNGKLCKNIKMLKKFIGYVPQDDIMHRELTVSQNIRYSADIRLPRDWSVDERKRHHDAVLEILDLKVIRNSVIGDEETRGISGGQRKRTNIGIELAAAPLVLFCDEPTSGLDSSSSLHVINTFKSISHITKITVVIVIHQPRVEIWNSLDNILVLAPGGLTVYSGKQKFCKDYFENLLQVTFNVNENQADRILDSVSNNGPQYAKTWMTLGKKYVEDYEKKEEDVAVSSATTSANPVEGDALGQVEDGQSVYTKNECDVAISTDTNESNEFSDNVIYGANFLNQFCYAFIRSVRQQYMTVDSFLLEIGLSCLAGLILGFAGRVHYSGTLKLPYIDLSPTAEATAIPQKSLFLQISVGIAASSSSVRVFGDEKTIFLREAASGHNRIAYFLAVSLAVVYRFFLNSLHYSCLFHIISKGYTKFELLFLNVFLNYYSVYGLTSAISMLLPRRDSSLLAAVTVIIFSVMNGYVPAIPDPIKYIFYTFWSSEAYFSTETSYFKEKFLVDVTADYFHYKLDRLTMDFGLMFAIGTIYRIIALLLLLLFLSRNKR